MNCQNSVVNVTKIVAVLTNIDTSGPKLARVDINGIFLSAEHDYKLK